MICRFWKCLQLVSVRDRELSHLFAKRKEALAKKCFIETLFHVQLVLHHSLSDFLDTAVLRMVAFLDLHV